MPIPQFLLDRIRNSALTGEHVAQTFETLVAIVNHLGILGSIDLEFAAPGDTLEPDDLVPVLTLSLRRPNASSPGDLEHEKYPEE